VHASRAPRPSARLAAVLALALALAGCRAERTLRVTSDPPGAEVWIDDSPHGTTPVDVQFEHYGTRRVTFRKPDYGTASLLVELEAPWFARFPIDLVSEVLLPVGWKDHHSVHAVLRAGAGGLDVPLLRSVLDRAEVLRRAGPRGPGDLPPVVASDQLEPEEEEPGSPR
jgi:hypothetical protein